MKALTLHQPWASLVALGIKTIETRSWSTRYRGPLAIHAGMTKGDPITAPWGPLVADDSEALLRDDVRPLPLGAVVATCRLHDVVPMQSWSEHTHDGPHLLVEPNMDLAIWCPERRLTVEDQRPYGDFAPGRYAWLLGDVERLTPVPVRGRQGLWEWTT